MDDESAKEEGKKFVEDAMFDGLFGDKFPKEPGLRAGKNNFYSITIPFDEAVLGTQKTIEVERFEICNICGGSGSKPGLDPQKCVDCQGNGEIRKEKQTLVGSITTIKSCTTCQGRGRIITSPCVGCNGQMRVKTTRPVTVNIHSGIDSGTQICLSGQGELGNDIKPDGNLYVTVDVLAHPLFTRNGANINIVLPVRAGFARKGGQLRVPKIEKGRFTILTLPPKTKRRTSLLVEQNATYTLTAIIQTYQPYNVLALSKIRKRLQAIRDSLYNNDFEINTL
jgi:molecular chaperone DnaJ